MLSFFPKLLKLEGSDYFLVTPSEKWKILVDVAPLFVISANLEIRQGYQALVFRALTGDTILLGSDNPLQMKKNLASEEIHPLVLVRNNINALISRATYYQLVDWCIARPYKNGQMEQLLESMGCEYSLGFYSE